MPDAARETFRTIGAGKPVLVLPALSTLSARREIRLLAGGLAAAGFAGFLA